MTGVWLGSRKSRVVIIAIMFVVHLGGVMLLVDTFQHANHVLELTESLYILLCNIMVSCKIYYVLFSMRRIAALSNIMDSAYSLAPMYQELSEAVTRARRASKMFFIFCEFTGMGFGLYPLLDYLIFGPKLSPEKLVEESAERNVSRTSLLSLPVVAPRPLPFRVWTPWDQTISPQYELTYLVLAMHATFMGFFLPAADVFLATLVLLLCGLLRVVQKRLRNLVPEPVYQQFEKPVWEEKIVKEIETNIEQDEGTGDAWGETEDGFMASVLKLPDNTSVNSSTELVLQLRRVVREHQAILEYVKRLNAVFSPMLLIQFCFSISLICLTGFQALLAQPGTLDFTFKVSYLGAATLEVFILCWAGEQLVIESKRVAEAVYSSSWFASPPALRRLLQMVLLRAQKPLSVRVAGFAVLSIPTFTSIIQMSYSYLTVLRELLD